MFRYVEVQDSSAAMIDHEEAVQQAEGQGRHREEINGCDHLPMVLEEAQPWLARPPAGLDPSQISRYRPLRDGKTQFQQLALNPWGAPGGILSGHALNELPYLKRQFRAATLVATRAKAPIQAEPFPMPPCYGLWLDDHQDLRPSAPEASQGDPEQSIEPDKARSRILAFEHAQLLAQDSNLKPKTVARAKERTEPTKPSQKQPDHRASLHDKPPVAIQER